MRVFKTQFKLIVTSNGISQLTGKNSHWLMVICDPDSGYSILAARYKVMTMRRELGSPNCPHVALVYHQISPCQKTPQSEMDKMITYFEF